MRHTPALPMLLAALAIALLTTSLPPLAGASDALLDAKRDAAAKLLKDGKTADAQKLYEEVIAADDSNWSDHYALAKIYDKAGETGKAVERYRQTVKELKNKARASSERSALADSEKRLKVLDEVSERLENSMRAFVKELGSIEEDAEKTSNHRVISRVRTLQLALLQVATSDLPEKVSTATVYATADWLDTGIDVGPNNVVRITAHGAWSVNKDPASMTGPQGSKAGMEINGFAAGCLLARIGHAPTAIEVGSSTVFRPTEAGRLQFMINDNDRRDNAGYVQVQVSIK